MPETMDRKSKMTCKTVFILALAAFNVCQGNFNSSTTDGARESSATKHTTDFPTTTTTATTESMSSTPVNSVSPSRDTTPGTKVTNTTDLTKTSAAPSSTELVRSSEAFVESPTTNSTFSPGVSPHLTFYSSLITSETTSRNATTPGHVSSNNGVENNVASNPGLVAVLCIFFIVLALVLTIAIANAISSRKTHFEKLEDLPMNQMNEESPFAHYPPK